MLANVVVFTLLVSTVTGMAGVGVAVRARISLASQVLQMARELVQGKEPCRAIQTSQVRSAPVPNNIPQS